MNEVQPLKTLAEIEAVKSALQGRDKLLFIVGINSALRISDLLTLTVGDVRNQSATLNEKKTKKRKELPFNDAIMRAFYELVPADAPDDEPLFKSAKGGAIGRVQAYRILNNAAKRAGIEKPFSPHSLRKTFGYFAYNNGTDLALLMRILNHSSQRETLRYIGIEREDVNSVYHSVCL